MALTNRITVVELVWTLFCLPGAIWAFKLLYASAGDYYFLKIRKINGVRDYAAMTSLVLFTSVAICNFMFVLIGGIAMVSINTGYTHSQAFIAASFILVSLFLDIGIITVDRRRRILLQKIRGIENHNGD